MKISLFIKEKWDGSIKSEISGPFDNDTFVLNETPLLLMRSFLQSWHIIKFNIYWCFDKLNARNCLRGDLDYERWCISPWSHTASTRLHKCFISLPTCIIPRKYHNIIYSHIMHKNMCSTNFLAHIFTYYFEFTFKMILKFIQRKLFITSLS